MSNIVDASVNAPIGALELVAMLGSGALAMPISGLAGLVGGPEAVHSVSDLLTYKPVSRSGRAAAETIAAALTPLAAMAQRVPDAVFDATGSPTLATATKAIPLTLMAGMPLRPSAGTLAALQRGEDAIRRTARNVETVARNRGAAIEDSARLTAAQHELARKLDGGEWETTVSPRGWVAEPRYVGWRGGVTKTPKRGELHVHNHPVDEGGILHSLSPQDAGALAGLPAGIAYSRGATMLPEQELWSRVPSHDTLPGQRAYAEGAYDDLLRTWGTERGDLSTDVPFRNDRVAYPNDTTFPLVDDQLGAQWVNSSIDRAIADLAGRHQEPLSNWINTTVRKHIIRDLEPAEMDRRVARAVPAGKVTEMRVRGALDAYGLPRYIENFENPSTRVGALTDLYLRKWTGHRGTPARKSFSGDVSSDFVNLLYQDPVTSLSSMARDYVDMFPRGLSGHPSRSSSDAVFGLGQRAFPGLTNRNIRDMLIEPRRNIEDYEKGQLGIFGRQTRALRDMYEHIAAGGDAPYTGTRFRNSMSTDYQPFAPTLEALRAKYAAEDPYLSKLPANTQMGYLNYVPEEIQHAADILQTHLDAGELRPGALHHISVRDAVQRGEAHDARLAKMKEAERKEYNIQQLKNAGQEGVARQNTFDSGVSVDRIKTPSRAALECEAANSTWCVGVPSTAKSYLGRSELYIVRNQDGIGRVLIEFDPKTRTVRQIRNRTQNGPVPDEVLSETIDFVRSLNPRHVEELENLKLDSLSALRRR